MDVDVPGSGNIEPDEIAPTELTGPDALGRVEPHIEPEPHFAITPDDPEANPLRQNAAFKAFSAKGEERQMYKPVFKKAEIVGSYRMLGEDV